MGNLNRGRRDPLPSVIPMIPIFLACLLLPTPQEPDGGGYFPMWEMPVQGTPESVADLNGDGIRDWLMVDDRATGTTTTNSGIMTAVDGMTGAQLWKISGWQDSQFLGKFYCVADLDSDGSHDVVLGLPFTDAKGVENAGLVLALDGTSGAEVWRAEAGPQDSHLGERIVAIDLGPSRGTGILIGNNQDYRAGGFSNSFLRLHEGTSGAMAWEYQAHRSYENPSKQVVVVDLDHDGVQEVLLGSSATEIAGLTQAGNVTALDGRSGSVRWETVGANASAWFGEKLEVIDLDGDGWLEIASHSPKGFRSTDNIGITVVLDRFGLALWEAIDGQNSLSNDRGVTWLDLDANGTLDLVVHRRYAKSGSIFQAGQIQAWSGDGAGLMWSIKGQLKGDQVGYAVIPAELDGLPGDDVLLPVPFMDVQGRFDSGAILAVSGSSGALLWAHHGESLHQQLGIRVAVGDASGDGIDDVWVGEERSRGFFGRVFLIDGSDGRVLWTRYGEETWDWLGNSVQVFDADGDGIQELLATALNALGPASQAGGIMVWQGDGTLLWSVAGKENKDGIGDHVGVLDLDDDGLPEILDWSPTAGQSKTGRIAARSGLDGSPLWSFFGKGFLEGIGIMVAPTEDLDGIPGPEIAIQGVDMLYLYRGSDAGFQPFLAATADAISRSAGGNVELDLKFDPSMAFGIYQLLASAHGTQPVVLDGLSIPLTPDPWFWSTWAGRYPGALVDQPKGILNAAAAAAVLLKIPPSVLPPALIGHSIWFSSVAGMPWETWRWASVAVAIRIDP